MLTITLTIKLYKDIFHPGVDNIQTLGYFIIYYKVSSFRNIITSFMTTALCCPNIPRLLLCPIVLLFFNIACSLGKSSEQ